MGWLGEVKRDIDAAKESRDEIHPEPTARLDMLVYDASSGEPRLRTDYAGTVWYGGRPQPGRTRPAGGAELAAPFWLPDSHRYDSGLVAGASVQASAALQSAWISSAGGSLQIFSVAAAFGEDPDGGGSARVYLAVSAAAELPLGVSYRVTVVCAPAAVLGDAADSSTQRRTPTR